MKFLAIVVAALFLIPATAVAAKPCPVTHCSHTLRLGAGRVTWKTPERFTVLDRLEAYVGKKQLSLSVSDCTFYLSGHGIMLRISGCGPGAQHLRVTAASVRGKPVAVRFVYG